MPRIYADYNYISISYRLTSQVTHDISSRSVLKNILLLRPRTDMGEKMIIWLTGQPGAGKTTLAKALAEQIPGNIMIDGDDLRAILSNPNYTKEGRYDNIRTAQRIAQFCQAKGMLPIVSLVSPYLELREELKAKTPVLEVYVHCDCERGREKFFAQDYEPPKECFIDIDTTKETVYESTEKILHVYRSLAAPT